ncbi:MAG: extracellular solute-binding protein [Treponema sp.]|nr:extracellular solute-binding protein [Treponema sp.]
MKKAMLISLILVVLMLIGTMSVFASGRQNLRGMEIVIGNWWSDYDTATKVPISDFEERELEYRRRIQQENNFRLRVRNIASWGEMSQIAATSIMAGRPAASVFTLQPDWALALYRQNLLYPVSDSRVINWASQTPVEWNQDVTRAFSFNGKSYAFMNGIGGSYHATCVFWNKRLFREAGLNPDLPYDLQRDGTWTWARFLEICRTLTRDVNNDGIMDTYGLVSDLSTEILDAFVVGNGAMYVDKDPRTGRLVNATNRPEFIEAVRFYMQLRDAGVMKPKPIGPDGTTGSTPWNWHIPEFQDGRVAMRIDQVYIRGDLRNMRDDWGVVLPPKGPRSTNYRVFTDENVYVIPRSTPAAQVDQILFALNLWFTPVPGTSWKDGLWQEYRDERAVNETWELIRNPALQQWRYNLHVPGLNRGGIAWQIWWHDGEPAQLIEAVSQNWNALIDDANGM